MAMKWLKYQPRKPEFIYSALSNIDTSLECLNELGLTDGTIQDFQISASSSTTDHGPPMVRPTLTSWCPTNDDFDPYVQV